MINLHPREGPRGATLLGSKRHPHPAKCHATRNAILTPMAISIDRIFGDLVLDLSQCLSARWHIDMDPVLGDRLQFCVALGTTLGRRWRWDVGLARSPIAARHRYDWALRARSRSGKNQDRRHGAQVSDLLGSPTRVLTQAEGESWQYVGPAWCRVTVHFDHDARVMYVDHDH